MKRYFPLLFLTAMTLLVWSSCKRTLESEPLEILSPDYVWDTQDSAGVNAGKVLTDVYSVIPDGFNRIQSYSSTDNSSDFLDAATDDAISSSPSTTPVQLIATGAGFNPNLNSEGGSFSSDFWGKYYTGIRKASVFIANIDKVPLEGTISGGRSLRAAWKAEARFLRALYYFELVKRWGGVPLMGDKIYQITDNVLLKRNSFEECVNYIASECDSVKDKLRDDPIDDPNFGRVTRGTAMALKARVLLYAASPLYNGGNTSGMPEAGYTNYDGSRWKKASDAARDIINYGKFSLLPSFSAVFTTALNSEVIFARNDGPSTNIETNNGPVGFAGNARGNGRTSPTEDLVEAFPMKDGKPIGTSPTYAYDPSDPFGIKTGGLRDPRLDLTVLHFGSKWLNTTIQTYDGGPNKPGGTKQQTKTSYYLRKFMGDFTTQTAYAATSHNFIMFRYAEVLLNFAEAENEVNGPTSEVYQAIGALRKRAGIDVGDGRYGLDATMTQAQMRTIIRNERRIELAFEEHRYWDIRRWKIAGELAKSPLHGLDIQKSNLSGTYTVSVISVLQPGFDESKAYLYPIPQSEIDRNPNLKQNPGW